MISRVSSNVSAWPCSLRWRRVPARRSVSHPFRGLGLTENGELDLRPRRAAHALDDLVHRLADDVLAVDADDLVAALDPRFLCGRTLDRCNHDQLIGAPVHLDADTPKLTLGVVLELFPFLGGQVVRVWVERLDHPFDRPLDELFAGGWVDVVVLDLDENPTQLVQGFIGVLTRWRGLRAHLAKHQTARKRTHRGDQEPKELHPLRLSPMRKHVDVRTADMDHCHATGRKGADAPDPQEASLGERQGLDQQSPQ